jgi:hypothetical protein
VRLSRIPGSGRGLFAAVRIHKNQTVALYGGYLTKRHPTPTSHTFQIAKGLFIDGHPDQFARCRTWRMGVAQFTQGSDATHRVNSRFVVDRINQRVRLVALRTLEAGDEVFVKYR